ncbi:MAG: hypothetical protein Q4E22_04175 [Coriobacteriia bacterium]|nr:hypothetical protein [Coriobacteriia bacterium]
MKQKVIAVEAYQAKLMSLALSQGVSKDLALYALKECKKYLSFSSKYTLNYKDQSRMYAYFFEIIKQKAPKNKKNSSYTQRVVLQVFVRTLMKSGRTNEDIAEELERNYSGSVNNDLLMEVREKLLAA